MKSRILVILTAIFSSFITIILFAFIQKGEAEIVVGNNSILAPGTIEVYSKNTAPSGYLLCNGQAVSRTTYANLFAVIGTTYGAGNGSTTFNVPNLSGKLPIGTSSSHAFASTGGATTHTHSTAGHAITIAELPKHSHQLAFYSSSWTDKTVDSYMDTVQWGAYTKTNVHYALSITDATDGGYVGGNAAHNHGNTTSASSMQPYIAMTYIIKY